jgi:hypothetical protein
MRARLSCGLVLVALVIAPLPAFPATRNAALAAAVAAPAAAAPATAPRPTPAWIAASNAWTRKLMVAQARFLPEDASSTGLSEFDGLAMDIGAGIDERYAIAMEAQREELRAALAKETDPQLRQDLQILIGALDIDIAGERLSTKYERNWIDVPKLAYGNLQALMEPQLPAARRAKALELLQRYTGLAPGSTALVVDARARFAESAGKPGVIGPVKAKVEGTLANVPTYIDGIRELFAREKLAGAEPALAAMEQQFRDYADFRLPPELYAFRLKRIGIDIDPALLVQRAQVEYIETRNAMQQLAPTIAKARGWADTDYRSVLRALKKETIPNDKLEARYKEVNSALEAAIRKERVVDLPARPMIMRLASAAESAAQPAPHMQPPPMIGNTGEQGQFVLPIGNPGAAGKAEVYDDFNFPGAAWTLSAHEGRPGHELQFSAMIERGVSEARVSYAFNSVNVEGWALYAEAEMVPSEPPEGQLIALQLRMLRAARAMLDPMLNLGLISREDAGRVLTDDVMVSKAMARQELDRYTFNSPGQAGSYFYGYSRILQLRASTELALGPTFDRMAFNNFLLDQGLLPPDLLEAAVREQFIPARKAMTAAN